MKKIYVVCVDTNLRQGDRTYLTVMFVKEKHTFKTKKEAQKRIREIMDKKEGGKSETGNPTYYTILEVYAKK